VPGLAVQELKIADGGCALSFEDEAARIEHEICSVPGLLCNCCAGCESKVCDSCMHATAFHRCKHLPGRHLWRKGSLYGGKVDYQRVAGGSLAACFSFIRAPPALLYSAFGRPAGTGYIPRSYSI